MAAAAETGRILDGRKIADEIKSELKVEIKKLSFKPLLSTVRVGCPEYSDIPINLRFKAAEICNMSADVIDLQRSTTQSELIKKLKELSENPSVNGIMVYRPLDTENEIDTDQMTEAIDVFKEIDGLSKANADKRSRCDLEDCMVPPMSLSCMELIRRSGIDLNGKKAVILGHSELVSVPMADLLRCHGATVLSYEPSDDNIQEKCLEADVLVVDIKKPKFVKGDWVKPGAVVIDCGQNHILDENSKKKLFGDVDFEEAKKRASWITPVPGGIGPVAIAMMLKNTVESAKRR